MACWVTLDELKPLLDNIGADGVHLEMDFHNEREVEQAMRIVEEYSSSSSDVSKEDLSNIIRKSKFPQNPKRSVRFSGKRTKRSVQKRKARNTQKAETKVL